MYGHHHSYQRTCKVVGEVCEGMSSQGHAEGSQDYVAPVHVVLGMAGMGLSQNMVSPRPEWVEYATDREFGLGMLVADRSKLRLSFVLDADGQVITFFFFVRLFFFFGGFACLEPGTITLVRVRIRVCPPLWQELIGACVFAMKGFTAPWQEAERSKGGSTNNDGGI